MMKWSPLDDDDFLYFDIFSDLTCHLSEARETEADQHHVTTSTCWCRGMRLEEVGIPRMPHGMKSRDTSDDLVSLDMALKMLPKRRGRGRAKMLEEREDHFDLHVGRTSSLYPYLDLDQSSTIDSSSARDGMSEASSVFGDCEWSDSNTDDTTSDVPISIPVINNRRPTNTALRLFRKQPPVKPFNTECVSDFPSLGEATQSSTVDSDSSTSSSVSKSSAMYRKRGRRKTNCVKSLDNNKMSNSGKSLDNNKMTNSVKSLDGNKMSNSWKSLDNNKMTSSVKSFDDNKMSQSTGLRATAECFVPKNRQKNHLVYDIRDCDESRSGFSNRGNKNNNSSQRESEINHQGRSKLRYNSSTISNNGGMGFSNHDNSGVSNRRGSDISNHDNNGISNRRGSDISNHGNNKDIMNNQGSSNSFSNHSNPTVAISNSENYGNHGNPTVAISNSENSDSTSDSRNISWSLCGQCVVQLEKVPLTADLGLLEQTLENFGRLVDSECCVVEDSYALRYKFSNEEVCEWVVTYLHDTDMLFPDSPFPLMCFRVL